MNQDKEVNVNWLRINVPSVVTIVVAAMTITGYVQSLAGDLQKIEESRVASKTLLDRDLTEIKGKLDAVANAPFRLDLLEKNMAATNARMDNYLQTLGNKIDNVSDRVGGLTTKVEVLSQKIEALAPQPNAPQRSKFMLP